MRRREILLVGLAAGFGLLPRRAQASLAIAISLPELVRESSQVWIATPIEAKCSWVESKRGRHIVTHTLVRREAFVCGSASEASQLWVRTVGGSVDGVSQIAHGEADLTVGQRCVVFMQRARDVYAVTARAQGHFLIHRSPNGAELLRVSPNLPYLARAQQSAAHILAGRELSLAVRQIQAVPR